MLYLEYFNFPNGDREFDFLLGIKRKCYNSFYPFKVLSQIEFEKIEFEPITILYGGNGCGKTTALNVIAEKTNVMLELVSFIEDSARFFGCQFIISTHSPFILAMKGAKIYDMDEYPVIIRKWTELKNVRAFYDFFKQHEMEF